MSKWGRGGKPARDKSQAIREKIIELRRAQPDATSQEIAGILGIKREAVSYQARLAGIPFGQSRKNPSRDFQQVLRLYEQHAPDAEAMAAAMGWDTPKRLQSWRTTAERQHNVSLPHIRQLKRWGYQGGGGARFYQIEPWLLQEWRRHGSLEAVAALYGYVASDVRQWVEAEGIPAPVSISPDGAHQARAGLTLSPYPAERLLLEQAAARVGLPVAVFALNAALSVAREHQPQAYTPHQLQHLWRAREASGQPWTLDEVTARGLPLYWVPGWLAGQIEAGETLSSIASRHGYNARTVSNHAKRQGITLRRVIRLDQCGSWPATVADVAARAFDDQHDDAARWLSEQVANGYLRRVQRGVYDLSSK